MLNISRLALAAVLTVGVGGIMGIASSFVPATTAFAQGRCDSSPTACPPSSSSQPPSSSSQSSSEPSSSEPPSSSSEPSSSSSESSSSSSSSEPGDDPDPGNPGPGPNDPYWMDDDPRIDCRIKDDKPITNDMWIVNIGEKILEHDLKIRWRIPSTGQHGAFLLPKDIPVGEEKVLRDFLVDTEGGAECRIEIID